MTAQALRLITPHEWPWHDGKSGIRLFFGSNPGVVVEPIRNYLGLTADVRGGPNRVKALTDADCGPDAFWKAGETQSRPSRRTDVCIPRYTTMRSYDNV